MIIIWGAPIWYNQSEFVSSWDDCTDKCMAEKTCVFLERTDQNGCNLYRFGHVVRVEKLDASSGKKVAFKMDMPSNTCPISNDPPLYGENYVENAYVQNEPFYYLTQFHADGSFVNMYYSDFLIFCPNNVSKLFTRGGQFPCLQVRFFPKDKWCGNYEDASALCRESGGISLTGPASQEEWEYLQEQSAKHLVMATGTPASMENKTMAIWIDGWCKETANEFVFEDPTHYGIDPYPFYSPISPNDGVGNCLFFPWDTKVDNAKCSLTETATYCYRGAACLINNDGIVPGLQTW